MLVELSFLKRRYFRLINLELYLVPTKGLQARNKESYGLKSFLCAFASVPLLALALDRLDDTRSPVVVDHPWGVTLLLVSPVLHGCEKDHLYKGDQLAEDQPDVQHLDHRGGW